MFDARTRNTVVMLLGVPTLLAGCGREPAEPAPVASAPAAAVPAAAFSINELMVMIVDRPGELLWDAEKAGQAPRTADEWYELENHAVELATAGTLIQLGGTGPSDEDWAADPLWRTTARQMSSAAISARAAARNRDLDALVKANGEIVAACEGCHKKFKPDIPTGKLFLRRGPSAAPKS